MSNMGHDLCGKNDLLSSNVYVLVANLYLTVSAHSKPVLKTSKHCVCHWRFIHQTSGTYK